MYRPVPTPFWIPLAGLVLGNTSYILETEKYWVTPSVCILGTASVRCRGNCTFMFAEGFEVRLGLASLHKYIAEWWRHDIGLFSPRLAGKRSQWSTYTCKPYCIMISDKIPRQFKYYFLINLLALFGGRFSEPSGL